MLSFRRKISTIMALSAIVASSLTGIASAHVVVKPAEAVTSGFVTFNAGVPNEKDLDVTALKVLIPEGLQYVQPSIKNGWKVTVEKDGSGEEAVITSITWTGGTIPAGFRDDFTFSARVPEKATELQWKAYQTYSDGTVVAWDQADENTTDTKGPYSVTDVVAKTESEVLIDEATDVAENSRSAADTSLYLGVAALLVSLAALYFSTKKR